MNNSLIKKLYSANPEKPKGESLLEEID